MWCDGGSNIRTCDAAKYSSFKEIFYIEKFVEKNMYMMEKRQFVNCKISKSIPNQHNLCDI